MSVLISREDLITLFDNEIVDNPLNLYFRRNEYIVPSDAAVKYSLETFFPFGYIGEEENIGNPAINLLQHFNGLLWTISYITIDIKDKVTGNYTDINCYINDALEIKFIDPYSKKIYNQNEKITFLLMP